MARPAPDAPVVALDIDGTLGDYHRHFMSFLSLYLGRPVDWDTELEAPFYRQLGVSKTLYRQAKVAYRQGGMKRSIPAFPGATELTHAIRRAGAQVWICTTRPYLRFDNIDPDTRHWLRRNRIQFDGFMFGEHKYSDLVKIVGRDRVVAVLDDLPQQVERADKIGLVPILRRNESNKRYVVPNRIPYVWDLHEAATDILTLIEMHKKGVGVYAHR